MAHSPEEQSRRQLLDKELGPVVCTFTIDQIPAGSAPDWVKREWLRLTFPVREALLSQYVELGGYTDYLTGHERHNEQPVPVYGQEAIDTLRTAGRTEAADYWAEQGFEFASFVFRSNEGNLVEVVSGHEDY